MTKNLLCIASLCYILTGMVNAEAIPPDGDKAMDALKNSPRHGEFVDIALTGSDAKLKAFVAYPERKENAPVVIVIHEIFGLSDWVRAVADQLAAEGFIAIAPDMLSGKGPNGGGTDSFGGDAVRSAIRELKPDEIKQRLDAARGFALALPSASKKSATIGFCWGGGASFTYAANQPELNAAVVYYGSAPAKELIEKIKAPILGCYGEDDARITATVESTKQAMEEAGKKYEPHVYAKAGHGFLRQQNGKDGANLQASKDAWNETIKFLKETLKD